eukprot:8433140-Pyramimonas_sp.AAC.1
MLITTILDAGHLASVFRKEIYPALAWLGWSVSCPTLGSQPGSPHPPSGLFAAGGSSRRRLVSLAGLSDDNGSYRYGGPIRRGKRGYILTTDQSGAHRRCAR